MCTLRVTKASTTSTRLKLAPTRNKKCLKIKGSDDVCFYSDSYHLKLENANKLQSLCRDIGLDVRIFEWDFPKRPYDQNDRPPSTTVKIIGGGYKQLYRGKLVGFVVGAYNNPLREGVSQKG